MASVNDRLYRVKITRISPNTKAHDLADALRFSPSRVGIPSNQTNQQSWYAWITGFESEEDADAFVKRWHNQNVLGTRITVTANPMASGRSKSSDHQQKLSSLVHL